MSNFYYKDYYINIIRKSTNKNVYLRLQNDGSIRVTSPFHVEDEKLLEYIDKFILKISNKYDLSKISKLDYKNNIMLLGVNYPIKIITGNKNNVQLKNECLLVYVKEEKEELIKKLVDKYLLDEAKIILTKRFNLLVQQFQHIDFIPKLKIRAMNSKFGTCYYKKNEIILASMLLHYDYSCIDYVIIHELAHFIQPNHSKKFYQLISMYLPDYKAAERKLKNLR